MKEVHRRRKLFRASELALAVVASVGMAAFIGACGSSSSTSSSPGTSSKSSAASPSSGKVKPFSIAVIGGESGLYGTVGQDQHQGVALAIKQLNASGGVDGAKISATYADDGGDPTRGVNAATQAVSNGASAIVGSPDTGAAIAAVLTRLKVPEIGEIQGGGPIIYPKGLGQPPNKWAFELAQDVTIQAQKMAQIAVAHGCKKNAILHDTTSYGTSSAAAVVSSLKAPAPVINDAVPENWTQSSAPDVGPELLKLKSAQVDCILSFVSGPAAARLAVQGKQGGYTPLIIGGNQLSQTPEYPKLGGTAVNGTLSVTFKALYSPNALYKKVAQEYAASGGKLVSGQPRSPFVNIGYDSVMAIAAAVKLANSSNPADIRDALEKLSNVEGSLGAFSFSPQKHSGFGPVDLATIELQNGVWKPQAASK
jgi:branched-chain amino acid transport system substrate-binding protein